MEHYDPFDMAKPVWGKGLVHDKNCQLGFVRRLSGRAGRVQLCLTAAGQYFVYLNGIFAAFGPARAARGYFRVDTLSLSLPEEENWLAILTVNPGIRSFGLMRQDAFLQAELTQNGEVLAATGAAGLDFASFVLTERVQKVQRYSYQRPFAEGYRLRPGYIDWIFGKPCENAVFCETEIQKPKQLLPRRLHEAAFPAVKLNVLTAAGEFELREPETVFRDRSLLYACQEPEDEYLEGYPENELEWQLSHESQRFHTTKLKTKNSVVGSARVCGGEFCILELPGERSGFLSMHLRCDTSGSLYVLFDEILDEQGDVNPMRLCCCNVIRLDCEEGEYRFQSRECYALRYCKFLAVGGTFEVNDVELREVICPEPLTWEYHSSNGKIETVLQAAKQTFLQNSADIFMDCPSRERAGWLCDSFFLGRSEFEFTGKNAVERNFLENYGLPQDFGHLPAGMVPMCYPSDQTPEGYIPNWAMWLLIELAEYCERTGDRSMAELFVPRTEKLLGWFARYENRDGLLEKLPGWVFVEWSKANDFVQDVSYPTNMLYGYMLQRLGVLYARSDLQQKGSSVLNTVRKKAFDGDFFVDNAVCGSDGIAVNTGNRTETCQYYAFFTGTATPQTYPTLWKRIMAEFGPERVKKGNYPEIYPSNAFIGNYLRMILLVRYGCYRQMLEESVDYFYYMAQRTGTLWEYAADFASCNHGFASYLAYLIRVSEESLKKEA